MKTFMNTMVLTVVLGLSMSGVAKADFDDEDVRDGALRIRTLANVSIENIRKGTIEVPFVQRRIIVAGFRSISIKAQQVINLSGAADEDAVQAEMLELTQEIQRIVNTLAGQADGNAELLQVLEQTFDLATELTDDLD